MPAVIALSTSGERRHLTVLFCDLVGSTEIAGQLDPEEWREVVAGYDRAAAEAITRFGGNVAKYLGDGIMAYFGWPEAHDNDAERAARAGLAILEALQKANNISTGPKLAGRVGIDSGAVVVGAGADEDADVFGETPNIAARLQATATPGTVLITAATHRLISGLFVVDALGPRALKGITTPLQVFQVLRPTGVRGRLQSARGVTPFVGREEELRLLLSRWERAREGDGQLAFVVGEAGIGKSRLVAEFRERIRDTPHIWMESAGEEFFENTPFHSIIEMFSQWLELQGGANAQEQFDRLERALASAGVIVAEIAPLIADLLQLPAGERYPALALTAEEKRRRLLAAISEWILGTARLQPLVMVSEDLHWLDPSTLELLQLLAPQGASVPLMLLCTARPEFRVPWPMRTHHSQIALNRLSSGDVRKMVAGVTARSALAIERVEAVVQRTGGVPLFVEELTRAVLEGSNEPIAGQEIPATLHDSLMARLDRLGSAKETIQIGAVIGSEFSYRLLNAVHPMPDKDVQAALQSATDAELIYVRGLPPDANYLFKHALIRDAAYGALLRSRRKGLHSRIAEVLRQQFSERATSAPEVLAHHYTEAGLIEEAIPCWQQAGQRASERSANAEAISQLTKGLELLRLLPDGPEHIQQELTLQTILGPAFIAAKGYAAPEVERTFARARELCSRVDDTVQLFSALYGSWWFHFVAAKLKAARTQAEELLEFAARQSDRVLLVTAHRALGYTLYDQGEFSKACAQFEKAMAIYTSQLHSEAGRYGGTDPGVGCLCFDAMALWYRGYPDRALEQMNEAIDLAQQLSHPLSLSASLNFAARVGQHRREASVTRARAEASILCSAELGFTYWLSEATILKGWTLAEEGQAEEGLIQMRQGLDAHAATGARLSRLYYLALIAEAHGKVGRFEDGLAELDEALDLVQITGEREHEAELHRLKGELMLKSCRVGSPHSAINEEAKQCFQDAIDIARNQQAKSLELRAVTSMGRLLHQQGRKEEARKILFDIYDWFTQGFDTADLKDAKALLEELST
ncbi:MAG TPA: AAA family ATPase [Candidatus Sulfotelmatobacter sp.]|nr:AAA family ATPase [Candidatus Sulfotelmatobacter sp.]